MVKVIPFKVFMIGPKPSILSGIDGGLTFFIGLGSTLLILIALEKLGVTINETLVRAVSYGAMGFGFLMLCWKLVLLVG
ncbi:hypothetical protein HPT25_28195 [Bacillus sp. BRMEA1]|uniref:hypothetical protein n=1 Tax=Neobacillus endophyticus TaxID=2738405 RepID=UPI00156672C6|nr:hypothetical protein [Neobacillus endophyticus]NRD81176.1 hypothetical protein [Neobacillus endophyticus]